MANEVILFKDSEALAITWLTGKLGTGVAIATRVPDPRPDGFVKVVVTGGHRLDLAYRATQLTFECWANVDTDASDIAALVDGHMNAAEYETINGSFVRKVTHVGGPVYSEDPESHTPRYLVTKSVQYRGYAAEES